MVYKKPVFWLGVFIIGFSCTMLYFHSIKYGSDPLGRRYKSEVEDALDREKKMRGDVEKAKKNLEQDLETSGRHLEETIRRKDMEINGLKSKLEDESNLVAKFQKRIKELHDIEAPVPSDPSGQKFDQSTQSNSIALHPSVNVLPSAPSSHLPYKDCVPLPHVPRKGVKICIYPSEKDIWISESLKRGILWEGDLVYQMLDALRSQPDMQLVDIGANIGVFSLSAAAAGYDVIAVEMMPANAHMMQHSLQESGLGPRVTLVNNAVFSDHRTMGTKAYKGNVGGTSLDFSNTTNGTVQVKTICMDDLIPLLKHKNVYIKMDIQTAELKALSCSYKFFQRVNVQFLMMEWIWKTAEDSNFAKTFFKEHGMKPSVKAMQYIPTSNDLGQANNNNVFFIKT